MLHSARVRTAIVLGSLVLLAALILVRGERAPAPQNIVAWSGSGTLLQAIDTTPRSPSAHTQSGIYAEGVTLDTSRLSTLDTNPSQSNQGFDFASILDQITNTPQPLATGTGNTAAADAIRDAFALVPQFNTQLSTSAGAQARTPEQEAIYTFGNVVGSIIKAYEAAHPNVLQIVTAQAEDRTNAAKAAALQRLASDIAQMGADIATVAPVPTDVEREHRLLAESYREAGALLSEVAGAREDAAVVATITAYTAAVNTLTERYGALATYFSLAGVRFSARDGGSVFSFGSF